jgi:hypothetical protein
MIYYAITCLLIPRLLLRTDSGGEEEVGKSYISTSLEFFIHYARKSERNLKKSWEIVKPTDVELYCKRVFYFYFYFS